MLLIKGPMKRRIIQARSFSKNIDSLIRKNKLLSQDFEDFKKGLVANPALGDLVPGTGGIRKTRIKSSSKGKRGGFRVCYFDDVVQEILYLLLIYPKNVQENLTPREKKDLKQLTTMIKSR